MSGEDMRHGPLELILGLTAFASGTVDIISFTKLGGVLASAMTGNLAFLGYFISRGAFSAALGSLVALLGFMLGAALGTAIGRGRGQRAALLWLLTGEALLLLAAAWLWWTMSHTIGGLGANSIILALATPMGMQSIVGKRVNLSNIPTVVFTSTLTNIMVGLTELVMNRKPRPSQDTRRQLAAFGLYFLGALAAGLCEYRGAGILIFLPAITVLGAWAAARVR